MIHIAARQYLGTPFRHRGREPFAGIDCVGLAVLAARECGWEVQDLPDYSRFPIGEQLDAQLRLNCGAPVAASPRLSDMQPGDLISIRMDGPKGPVNHVGIVGDHPHGLSVIHTYGRIARGGGRAGKVVEHRIDAEFLSRIQFVYRRVA